MVRTFILYQYQYSFCVYLILCSSRQALPSARRAPLAPTPLPRRHRVSRALLVVTCQRVRTSCNFNIRRCVTCLYLTPCRISAGSIICTPCAAGTYSSQPSTSCTTCAAGGYAPKGEDFLVMSSYLLCAPHSVPHLGRLSYLHPVRRRYLLLPADVIVHHVRCWRLRAKW
jgi:hypothetical protein